MSPEDERLLKNYLLSCLVVRFQTAHYSEVQHRHSVRGHRNHNLLRQKHTLCRLVSIESGGKTAKLDGQTVRS